MDAFEKAEKNPTPRFSGLEKKEKRNPLPPFSLQNVYYDLELIAPLLKDPVFHSLIFNVLCCQCPAAFHNPAVAAFSPEGSAFLTPKPFLLQKSMARLGRSGGEFKFSLLENAPPSI